MKIWERIKTFKFSFNSPQQEVCSECLQNHSEVEQTERILLMQEQRHYIKLKKMLLMLVFFITIIYAFKTVYGSK